MENYVEIFHDSRLPKRSVMYGNVTECGRAVYIGLLLGKFIMILPSNLQPVYSVPVRLLCDLPASSLLTFLQHLFFFHTFILCTLYFGQPFYIICHFFSLLSACKHEYLCTWPINSSRRSSVTWC